MRSDAAVAPQCMRGVKRSPGSVAARHVEPAADERQRRRQRMAVRGDVVLGPHASRRSPARPSRASARSRRRRRRAAARPRSVLRVEQVQRPLGHQLPDRRPRAGAPSCSRTSGRPRSTRRARTRSRAPTPVAEHARQPVRRRVGRRLRRSSRFSTMSRNAARSRCAGHGGRRQRPAGSARASAPGSPRAVSSWIVEHVARP